MLPALQDATDWATGVTTERPKIVKARRCVMKMAHSLRNDGLGLGYVLFLLQAGQRLTVLLKFSRQAHGVSE